MAKNDMTPLAVRLLDAIEASGKSRASVSKEAGMSATYVRDILEGRTLNPPADKLRRLSEVLLVSFQWLAFGEGTMPQLIDEQKARSNAVTFRPESTPTLPARTDMPLDVPVYGTAAGSLGQGSIQMDTGQVIDRVRRPPGIATATDIYAIYVTGSSMVPRFEEGELVYISERRPARIGDHVIIQVQNGEHEPIQAYVKRLARRTAETLMLEQYNPSATIEIPMAKVKAVHRILTMNDLFGV